MRKMLVVAVIGALLVGTVPSMALAGDSHAVSNRWAGAAIGAGAVVLGGLLLNALQAPAPAPEPVYAPPPVYTPAPPVVYAPAPVIVHRAPVVVHRGHWDRDHDRGWRR